MRAARYRYAGPFREYWRAEAALHDMFADGDVMPAEGPRIERHGRNGSGAYFITLPA
jgi:hypothetical protein